MSSSSLTAAAAATVAFEVPAHLTPLPSDTEAERQKKRRAIKALKSKFKNKQMTVESEVKQKHWQNFMQKKSKKNHNYYNKMTSTGSIFQTQESIDSKVGVIRGPSTSSL